MTPPHSWPRSAAASPVSKTEARLPAAGRAGARTGSAPLLCLCRGRICSCARPGSRNTAATIHRDHHTAAATKTSWVARRQLRRRHRPRRPPSVAVGDGAEHRHPDRAADRPEEQVVAGDDAALVPAARWSARRSGSGWPPGPSPDRRRSSTTATCQTAESTPSKTRQRAAGQHQHAADQRGGPEPEPQVEPAGQRRRDRPADGQGGQRETGDQRTGAQHASARRSGRRSSSPAARRRPAGRSPRWPPAPAG